VWSENLAVGLGHAIESVWSPRWWAMKTAVGAFEGIVIVGISYFTSSCKYNSPYYLRSIFYVKAGDRA